MIVIDAGCGKIDLHAVAREGSVPNRVVTRVRAPRDCV